MGHVLEIRGIKKRFPGVRALDWSENDVVRMGPGESWALAGENGAGKSTLTHILSGVYQKDGGEVLLQGKPYAPATVKDAWRAGVAEVLQEPGLIPSLTVAENLFVGREDRFTRFGIHQKRLLYKLAEEAMGDVCPHIDPRALASQLSLEDQKLVELSRALSLDPVLLIIDETSAALSRQSVQVLFDKMREVQRAGGVVIFVSHRFEEMFEHSEHLLVLKDGGFVTTRKTTETTPDQLSGLMVGREVATSKLREHPLGAADGPPLLEVRDLTSAGSFEGVSFEVRAGEILGIGGLAGAGQEEVLKCLFGDAPVTSGDVFLRGEKVDIKAPRDAIAMGFAYAPRNRDREGIILNHTIRENASLPSLPRMQRYGFIDRRREEASARQLISELMIKCQGPGDLCGNLSGGNRQKVVLARWVASDAKVLLLDNPTRGVDVGAKTEIYALLNTLTKKGIGIVMVSDELPELLQMSDRIIILRRGRISAEFTWEQNPTEHDIIGTMI